MINIGQFEAAVLCPGLITSLITLAAQGLQNIRVHKSFFIVKYTVNTGAPPHVHINTQTHEYTDRQTDRQTDGLTNRWTETYFALLMLLGY